MSDFVADFEWAELVFVPAGGDGEPAQWKTRGDLTADEFGRYAQGRADDADLQMKRALRYRELVDEYLEVGLDVPISFCWTTKRWPSLPPSS